MNPTKITIQGFGPYGPAPQTITIPEGGTTVILGHNGSGKSNSVEALLWAMHGSCLSRSGEKIINEKCGFAAVEVEFTASGNLYRANREVQRKKKGGIEGSVKLFQRDGENWKDISANTASGTTAKIKEIIGVDLDGHISTGVLAQGKSGEFTSKGPKDRKAVISQVLRFGVYQEYAEKAGAKAREKRDEALTLTGAIQASLADIERIPEAEARLSELTEAAKPLEEAAKKSEAELEEARAKHDRAQRVVEGIEHERQALAKEQDRVAEMIQQKESLDIRIAALRDKAATAADAQETVERLQGAQERLIECDQKFQDWREASDQYREKRTQVDAEIYRLETDLKAAVRDREALERELTDCENAKARIEALRNEIKADRSSIDAEAETRFSVAQEAKNRAALTVQALRSEIERITTRGRALKAMAGATCEYCGHELTAEHREKELAKLRDELTQKNSELDQAIIAEGRCIEEVKTAAEAVSLSNASRRDVERKESLIETLTPTVEKLESVQTKHTKAVTAIDALQTAIKTAKASPHLAQLSAAIDAVGYSEAAHKAAAQEAETLRIAKDQMHEAAGSLALIAEIEAQRDKVSEEAEELSRVIGTNSESIRSRMSAASEAEHFAMAGVESAGNQKAADDSRLKDHQALVFGAKALLDQLKKTEAELGGRRQAIRAVEAEQRTFETLQKAFGPSGVQAMLIENAVPAIEWEANEILGRISDGMRISFRTQKEHLNGGVSEVLDIIIEEAGKELPYEAFSGGFKFRIDFSIRVALAKVLAKMTGQAAGMLVVDEGFGSQDEQGVEALISAIYAIAPEFEKVLLISHLTQMKNAFDSVIQVARNEEDFSEIVSG